VPRLLSLIVSYLLVILEIINGDNELAMRWRKTPPRIGALFNHPTYFKLAVCAGGVQVGCFSLVLCKILTIENNSQGTHCHTGMIVVDVYDLEKIFCHLAVAISKFLGAPRSIPTLRGHCQCRKYAAHYGRQ
jgi:hypothetical protein